MASNFRLRPNWTTEREHPTDNECELTYAPMKLDKFWLSSRGSSNRNTCSNGSIIESNLHLLREKIHCDVTFIVGSSRERIQCHRLFMRARSPVFENMFSGRWNEGEEVEIPDIDPETFKFFLEFIYADKCVSNVSEALDLFYVTEKYGVELLVQKCEALLQSQVKPEDCIAVFQSARKYERAELMKKSGDLIAKSMEVLNNDGSITKMDKETLIYVLKRDDLVLKEVELFNMVVKWGKHQIALGTASGLKEALADIIPLIRFPIMTLNEFTTVVVPTALLPSTVMLEIFTYFGSDKTVQKQMEKSLKFSAAVRGAQAMHYLVAEPLVSTPAFGFFSRPGPLTQPSPGIFGPAANAAFPLSNNCMQFKKTQGSRI